MSKEKRSKIMAALLCATTMAAFYASPQMVYAVNLNHTPEGMVTTDSSGDNEAITEIDGLAGITFGVEAEPGQPPASVRLGMNLDYGGLYANGSITADSLYLALEGGERYDMDQVLGIHRNQDPDTKEWATSIESGLDGGGMQITNKQVGMMGGAAVFTKDVISFDAEFESAHGLKVNEVFELNSQGNIITSGTFNEMKIDDNQVNGVTLLDNEVTANEVTAEGYKLTEVGKNVSDIADKTQGIISYDSNTGTTFNGKIIAYAGVTTNEISNGADRFSVGDAADTIEWVGKWGDKVSGYDERITKNAEAIVQETRNKIQVFFPLLC